MTAAMVNPASALKALLALALLWIAASVHAADPIAVITHASGVVSVKRADAPPRLIAVQSALFEGDELSTEADTYVRIRFKDGARTVLRPNTRFVIKTYAYTPDQPQADNAAVSLIKGGLRAVTGALGQRSKDKVSIEAPTATIGIRGTDWGVLYCQNDCAGYAGNDGRPPANGLHVDVTQGRIVVSNAHGAQDFRAGQFGFVAANAAPVPVPPAVGVRPPLPPAFRNPDAPLGPGVGKDGGGSCRI